MSDCSPSLKPETKLEPAGSDEDPADIVKLFKSFQVEERVSFKTSRMGSSEPENASNRNLPPNSLEDDGPLKETPINSTEPLSDPGRYPMDEPSTRPPSEDSAKTDESTSSPSRTRNRESSSQNFAQILAALSALPPLPSIGDTDSLPASHATMIDDVMARVISDWRPSQEHEDFRRNMFQRLESFIYQMFRSCHLQAFGSSVNGFEFAEADLDCALVFPFVVNERQHVSWIAAHLAKISGVFYDVTAVTGCRVPIVRFKMRSGMPNVEDLSVDISIGNVLGIRNSAMLRRYSMIDRRVKPLGYIVKLFAKMTESGDARMGGLSSYAYLLLVIYYLQRCDPPVVPVLQELVDPLKPPNRSMYKYDRWDTYFFDGTDADLARLWPYLGRNNKSPGLLFLGFLRFFLEEFDYEKYVVCISNFEPLTRKRKGWTRHFLAIEDPFDLNHNLGAVADKDKLIYILRSWHEAFQVFSTPLPSTSSSTKSSFTSSSSPFQLPARYTSSNRDATPAHFLLDSLRYLECEKCGNLGCDFDNQYCDSDGEWPTLNATKKRARKCRGRSKPENDTYSDGQPQRDAEATNDSNGNTAFGAERGEKQLNGAKLPASLVSELKKDGISG